MRRRRSLTSKPTKAPSLAKLVKRRDFDRILNILIDDTISKQRWFEEEHSMLGENCLHIVLRSKPPARLVAVLLQCLKHYGILEPELSVDILGRTPLHHAVGFLCEPAVVQVLLNSEAGLLALRAQDGEGRLPLHVAVRPYDLQISKRAFGRLKKPKMSDERIQLVVRTNVEIILTLCPQAALATDDKGRTPLEYTEVVKVDDSYKPCVEQLSEELRLAAEVCMSEPTQYRHTGMVVEFSDSEDDDVSVLSLP